MNPRKRRMTGVAVVLFAATIATFLGLKSCDEFKFYFFDPSQVVAGEVTVDKAFRLGGMVKSGSFIREPGSLDVSFVVTDFAADVPVHYTGLLPDLFRECQGVVVDGTLNDDGVFTATTVLAKHDEDYMPPEVAESLKTDLKNDCGPK